MIKKLVILLLIITGINAYAQNVSIQLGTNKIAKNQYFTITAVAKNDKIKSLTDFPNINGFQKAGMSQNSSTNIINGRMSSETKYIQNYVPTKEGTFKLSPFQIKINGKTIKSKGTTITVGPAIQQQRYDPFQDFYGRGRQQQPREFVEVDDDAFFAITTDKKEVYEGEGYTIEVSFYIANSNRAPMDFYKLDKQIPRIEKLIKPENAWEEKTEITNISPENVTINNKQYRKFTFYQATYYPLSVQDISIKSYGLKMIKYKVAKQRSFFGNNVQEGFKTYYSKAKKIKVKPLPDHPLQDYVAVGNYKLKDAISTDKFETGKSFNYIFKIIGEGNVNAIKAPLIPDTDDMEVYPPNEKQNISRINGKVYGSKVFDYYMIPNEPKQIKLNDYFEWIYFNHVKEKYDTLYPNLTLEVTGESKKNTSIMSNDIGAFYDRITSESNKDIFLKKEDHFYLIVSVIVSIVSVLSLVLIFIKFKK